MIISDALIEASKLLRKNNIDTPRLDAEVILGYVLNTERLKLLTDRSEELTGENYEKYLELINMRVKGAPVSYITGSKEFMSLEFHIEKGVLIPRGDTEILTEIVLEECKRRGGSIKIADVCCGSGAIGISIAHYCKQAKVTLIDISDTAIGVSKINAKKNEVQDRVLIIKGDLLSEVIKETYDIIVSNPPYIKSSAVPTLDREVKDNEPHIALDGGKDGLSFYRKITEQSIKCLNDGGFLAYEIGYNQADKVSIILKQQGYKNIKVYKDLAGFDRCVAGYK
ncbi:release factor glutamine methyltransferase [Oxobacter pfennigii]|uniref:Release factor glutamine methyltransferase n=1 Tax=Oxobacter pfennigii TaxID=36849 RepID=A0A0P8W7H5_9CLOT|nr:peptide chain release factor N(5)-glutamine methyltransferase [Oxobacter pfennigii]KPU44610.1 release factor glutamine methyltransferase [Oxobacter pfennigii]